MFLCSSSDTVKVTTTTAANLSVYAAYTDRIGSDVTHGYAVTAISSATTTQVLASFTKAYNVRRVESMRIANTHASTSNAVTVQVFSAGTGYTMWTGTIAAGEVLGYDGRSFVLYNTAGVPKTYGVNSPNATSVLVSPLFATANLTGVRSITSTNSYAVYVGKAPRAITSANVRYRVTTQAATVTWAEIALATGSINVGGNPTLTVRGYADVSAVVTSTGLKTTSVSVSAGQAINEGDDLWAIYGNAATTVAVLRAQSIADDIQVGVFATLSTRPSTNVGSAQAYTIDGATAIMPWFAVVV